MKYRAVIREAWAVTQENKQFIWWFAFVPAVFELVVGMVYLLYQFVSFWNSPFFREGAPGSHIFTDAFNIVVNLFQEQPSLTVLGIIIFTIGAVIYMLLPVFTQGALIQVVANLRAGQTVSIPKAISFGFGRFLQLFEYSLFVKTFSLFGIATNFSFLIRSFGPKPFEVLGWFFLLFAVVGFFLTLLMTYAEYYIVIDKEGVFDSVVRSSGLVIRQWDHTLFMLFLMAIIVVRTGFNILVALVVPALVLGPLFLFTTGVLSTIGVIVGSLVGLVVLYFASYFLAVFHMFATTVWTFTFLELTKEESEAVDLHGAAVHTYSDGVDDGEN